MGTCPSDPCSTWWQTMMHHFFYIEHMHCFFFFPLAMFIVKDNHSIPCFSSLMPTCRVKNSFFWLSSHVVSGEFQLSWLIPIFWVIYINLMKFHILFWMFWLQKNHSPSIFLVTKPPPYIHHAILINHSNRKNRTRNCRISVTRGWQQPWECATKRAAPLAVAKMVDQFDDLNNVGFVWKKYGDFFDLLNCDFSTLSWWNISSPYYCNSPN